MTESKLRSLGLIPARIGSKRLKEKNIKLLNGKPLVAYTIQAALGSKLSDVVVSTDSKEVAEIARQFGAQVPFIRPQSISDDLTTNKKVLAHAVEFMEGQYSKVYDLLFVLQPTSPIRKSQHIDECIDLLGDGECDTLASVYGPVKKNQKNIKIMTPDGKLQDYREGEQCAYYVYNASIYGVKGPFFAQYQDYHLGRQIGYVMDKLHSVDVDDEFDFEIASHLMKTYFSDK